MAYTMASRPSTAVVEDDDWLLPYLATTKYANDWRLTANPAKPVPPPKKKYSLHIGSPKKASRKRSSERRSVVHPRENRLPDRVNAVRDSGVQYVRPVDGHFVREHGRIGEKSRRATVDFDELEAVQERVMQAANLWRQKAAT